MKFFPLFSLAILANSFKLMVSFATQKRVLHLKLAQAIGMMSGFNRYGQYIPDSKDADGNTVLGKDDAGVIFPHNGLNRRSGIA